MATELARYETALGAVDARPEQAAAIRAALAEVGPLREQLAQPAITAPARRELGPADPSAEAIEDVEVVDVVAVEVVEGTVVEPGESR